MCTHVFRYIKHLNFFAHFYLFTFAFGCAGSLCRPFSSRSDVVSRGYSLVAVRGVGWGGEGLIAVTSLVAEHGLQGVQASVVAAPRL